MDTIVWLDDAHDGAWNMAADEAMAEFASANRCNVLRFYRWSEPTLSLGYFQRASDRMCHRQLANVAFTRRLSGGGAILHDKELTYSIAYADAGSSKAAYSELYCRSHNSIQFALQRFGYQVTTVACSTNVQPGDDEKFLCFERRSSADLVTALGHKVVGSAQRRIAGVILQHGSILLSTSPYTPHLPGLLDAAKESQTMPPPTNSPMDFACELQPTLCSIMVESFASKGEQGKQTVFTGTEFAKNLAKLSFFYDTKYGSIDWKEKKQ